MYNAIDFLKDGAYTDGETNKSKLRAEDLYREKVEFSRPIKGNSVTFEVYDTVSGFTHAQWKRVVAVFVHGPEW